MTVTQARMQQRRGNASDSRPVNTTCDIGPYEYGG